VAIRLFFFLLVFANLLFFAWAQGYFGTSDEGREPQRMAQQLHPEKLRTVAAAQGPTAKKDEPAACRIINGLAAAEAEALRVAIEAAGGNAKIAPLAEPPHYLVVITDLVNKVAADKKAAELTRFGVAQQTTVALEDGRHEIVLGQFDSDAAAREFLQGLSKRGIKSARVEGREPAAPKTRVEARGPASSLVQQLPKLIAPYAGATVGECPP